MASGFDAIVGDGTRRAHDGDTSIDTSPEAIRVVLNAENRYLGGLTPADAAQVGRFDRVEAALEALDSGVFV